MSTQPNYNVGSATILRQSPKSGFRRDQLWVNQEYGQQNIWVLNPMHIVTLSTETKSKFVKVIEGFKQFSNKWFSHVLLLTFLILYGFIGAYVFVTLEAPIETNVKSSVNNMRERIIRELWWSSQKFTKGWWEKLAKIRMKEFERQLHESCISEQTTDSEKKVWTFWQALFFSSTIFTTIGYGHVVPKTDAGRVATIIYAFIGIPLLLMVLTDLGKLFTRGIKFVFKHCRKIYYMRHIRKVRSVGRRATLKPTQYVSVALDAVNRRMSHIPGVTQEVYPKSNSSQTVRDNKANENRAEDKKSYLNPEDKDSKRSSSRSRSSSPTKTSRPSSIIITTTNATPPQTSNEESTSPEQEQPPEFQVDDEFDLPISVAVVLLLLYMMIGAAVFTIWEDWSFFEAFYFIYISLSTIGFGDYVPDHPIFMMCTFIYLLFGLALTSMCINVVQEKLSATFQRAKLRIGATMGLDVQQLMEQDLALEQKEKEKGDSSDKQTSEDQKKGFTLKEHGIGSSLKERREKRRSPQTDGKPSASPSNSNRNSMSQKSVGFIEDQV